MFIELYAFAQIHLFNRGIVYRKAMSLRGGRKPDVAIRSKNVSIIWEFGIKRRVLRIRIATATGGLAMTMRNLMPYS